MIWYNIKINRGSMSFRIERLCPINFRPVTVAICLVLVTAAPSYAQGSSSDVQAKDQTPAVVAEPSTPVVEQGRSDENAIRTAEDAFGTSIGRETIGLYSSQNIRGFSPISAGNARIEGLYFDQLWGLTSRIRRSTTLRVGISALGFPFPAPTGIVDYSFRTPGTEASLGLAAGVDSYGASFVEADAVIPLAGDTLAIGLGGAVYLESYYNGTSGKYHNAAISFRWTPSDNFEIVPFWHRSEGYDDDTGPIFIPAGNTLPPPVKRRRFLGPDWATYRGSAINYGAFATLRPANGWTFRAGLFRSVLDDQRSFAHFLTDVTDAGTANRLIIADPSTKAASTSGELRLTREWTDGDLQNRIHLSIRGRDRYRRYDGSDIIDYGATTLTTPFELPQPLFSFSEQTRDGVQQLTGGIAYEGLWRGIGEIGLGVQRTKYRKRIEAPGLASDRISSGPWLYNINAAFYLTEQLAVYGGYTRGLEESGTAPNNAANRNELLPAILTDQRDAGLRYRLASGITVIAGLFDVRKPYFSLDAANQFELLGDIENKGIELSVVGNVTPRLNLVAGTVFSRPRVTGEGVRLGRVGSRPVGLAAQRYELNVDWQSPLIEGLSLDVSASHSSRVPATVNNLVYIAARPNVDIGGRYRFRVGRTAASARIGINNLTNEGGYELRGAGAYDLFNGRTVSLFLSADF
jgi:iron complex outermembrane receptor protein